MRIRQSADAAGAVVRVVGVNRDVTELENALANLAANEVLLRQFVPDPASRERLTALLSFVVGAGFVVVYFLGLDGGESWLFIGLICALGGTFALRTARLHRRIRQLENQIRASH